MTLLVIITSIDNNIMISVFVRYMYASPADVPPGCERLRSTALGNTVPYGERTSTNRFQARHLRCIDNDLSTSIDIIDTDSLY